MALFRPCIHGVEVTQGIQYYESASHLTDPADRQPDNSVIQIAGKPAWVRVYVRSGWPFSSMSRVAGTVTVRRRVFGWLWVTVDTLSPQPPGSVTAFREIDYSTERGSTAYTLNFIIPASMMCGRLRLDVRIRRRFLFFSFSHRRRLIIEATLRQTLRLAGIMVGYDGPESSEPNAPNLTLPAPTLADLQATSAWTLLVFPVRSAATYRVAGTITWDRPLTDPPSCNGCCSPNWVALNAAVQAVRVADGNQTDVLYYGLLATGIPMGPIVGCNTGGVSTGSNGAGITMAHELGHACGRPHSPCGTGGDPAYPAYEPYDPAGTPTASIGEYGLDISSGEVKPPNTFKDFMSYCGPRWVSLYVTGRLTNNAALDPARTCIDWPWLVDLIMFERDPMPKKWLPDPPPNPTWLRREASPEALISLTGVQHGPDEFEVRSVFRLDAHRSVPNGRPLDVQAELLDEGGHVLASGIVYSLRSLAHCGCHGDEGGREEVYPRLIQAFISDAASGAALRIRRGDRDLWSRRGPAEKPRVTNVSVEIDGEHVRLGWSAISHGDVEPECWAQWSGDQGRTWHALSTNLRGASAVLDSRGLPAGELLIRLLVSDGFGTAISRPVAVTIPDRSAVPSILSPRDGQIVVSPGSLRLWGVARKARGQDVADEDARWFVDDQEVAIGLDAFVATPPPGKHQATFAIKGPEGVATTSVAFTVVELRQERDEKKESRAQGGSHPPLRRSGE